MHFRIFKETIEVGIYLVIYNELSGYSFLKVIVHN